jgi:hypothetical protein
MLVLQACCDDDLTPMIGEWKGWRYCVYRPGQMPKNDIIVLAQHLHTVVGKARFASCSATKQAPRTNLKPSTTSARRAATLK